MMDNINRLEQLFQASGGGDSGGGQGYKVTIEIIVNPNGGNHFSVNGPQGLNLLQLFGLIEQMKTTFLQNVRAI